MFGCPNCPVAPVGCPRCSARLCMEHSPLPGEACVPCELAYHESRDKLRLNLWFALGFLVPWGWLFAMRDSLPSWSARSGGVRAITTGIPMLDVLIMFSIIAVFAGKAASGLRSWMHRREFLRA